MKLRGACSGTSVRSGRPRIQTGTLIASTLRCSHLDIRQSPSQMRIFMRTPASRCSVPSLLSCGRERNSGVSQQVVSYGPDGDLMAVSCHANSTFTAVSVQARALGTESYWTNNSVDGSRMLSLVVGNIGYFDNEINLAGSEGLEGLKIDDFTRLRRIFRPPRRLRCDRVGLRERCCGAHSRLENGDIAHLSTGPAVVRRLPGRSVPGQRRTENPR